LTTSLGGVEGAMTCSTGGVEGLVVVVCATSAMVCQMLPWSHVEFLGIASVSKTPTNINPLFENIRSCCLMLRYRCSLPEGIEPALKNDIKSESFC
jgi:hypothetical protein